MDLDQRLASRDRGALGSNDDGADGVIDVLIDALSAGAEDHRRPADQFRIDFANKARTRRVD